MLPSRDISRLIEIMAALRDPATGCPWDVEQTFTTIAPYTIEEAYEVADAIARSDLLDLQEELGDLLLQVVYHARIAEEAGDFAFGDVVRGITEKMIRRHPHVFGDQEARNARSAKGMWEKIKTEEKRERQAAREARGLGFTKAAGFLDGVPLPLPALTRALKLQAATEDEFGDVLFSLVNLGRKLKLDSEKALSGTNHKFRSRFHFIEQTLAAQGRTLEEASLEEMEAIWQSAKAKKTND
jgi:ATP diphosphatase